MQLDVAAVAHSQTIVINNPGYPGSAVARHRHRDAEQHGRPAESHVRPRRRPPASASSTRSAQGLTTSIDGVYSVGYNLFNNRDVNYPTFPGGPRPNPALGRLIQFGMEGHSWSTALLASLQYRRTSGPLFGLSYTLSRALRDVEDFQSFAQNELNQAADKGPANNDRLHQLVAQLHGRASVRLFSSPAWRRTERACRGRSRPVATTTST